MSTNFVMTFQIASFYEPRSTKCANKKMGRYEKTERRYEKENKHEKVLWIIMSDHLIIIMIDKCIPGPICCALPYHHEGMQFLVSVTKKQF